MSRYLDEAAAQIRKVTEENERRPSPSREIRMECGRAFAMLAAIEKGLLPQQMAETVYGQFGDGGGRR